MRVDASRLNKFALLLGVVATILIFVLVLRLLNVNGSQNNSVALETVISGTQQAAGAPASPSASPAANASTQITAVANAFPNVHSSIGVTSPILGTLARGQSVPVIGRTADGAWIEIRYANGVGWVSADLMAVSPASATIPVATPP